jgi:hypothetical protein
MILIAELMMDILQSAIPRHKDNQDIERITVHSSYSQVVVILELEMHK